MLSAYGRSVPSEDERLTHVGPGTPAAGRWPEAVGILVAIPIAKRIARSIALT